MQFVNLLIFDMKLNAEKIIDWEDTIIFRCFTEGYCELVPSAPANAHRGDIGDCSDVG